MFRDKAWHSIGSFGAALEAELSRVAGWQKAKWEANKGWVKAQFGVEESSSSSGDGINALRNGDSGVIEPSRVRSGGPNSRLTSRGGSPDSR